MIKHISTGFSCENKLTFFLDVPFFPNLHSAISSGGLFFRVTFFPVTFFLVTFFPVTFFPTPDIDRIYPCLYRKNLRLFQRFSNELDATIQTGQTSERPITGRSRVITRHEDRYICTLHFRNRFLALTLLATHVLGMGKDLCAREETAGHR